MALIKTKKQLTEIKTAGKILSAVFDTVAPAVKQGASLIELDNIIHQTITSNQCRPSFLNYEGFPKSSCISVNDQVIHSIPDEYQLNDGDILTIDIGLWYNKVCVDSARTYSVGKIDEKARNLIKYTAEALEKGISQAVSGNHIGAISDAIERVAKKHHFGIVRNYTGHGVGLAVHEEPSVPNIGKITDGIVLKPGMVLAIEPMFTLGGGEVLTMPNGWTVVTADGSLAAQFEHTIIVTNGNPIITTK